VGRVDRGLQRHLRLLRAGLDDRRGVAVVCGAGINCAGLLPDGTTARFAAVGHISGDWGGGGNLWQEAMLVGGASRRRARTAHRAQ
jgi:hypothetical protein